MGMADFSGGFDDDTLNDDGFGSSDFDTDSNFGSSDFDTGSSFDSSSGFEDSFNNNSELSENTGGNTKKTAIIAVAVGIIGVIAVVIIANIIANANKNSTEHDSAADNTSVVSEVVNTRPGQPVDDIMSSGHAKEEPSIMHSEISNYKNYNWREINGNEQIDFGSEYKDMKFLITDIKHYAKIVDTNGNLVVKTTLTGGLSGLTGSYELDVPYSKGVKLVIGDEFAVKVQFGTYNGKKVVGEIRY